MSAGELQAWLVGAFNFGTAPAQLVGNSTLPTVSTQEDTLNFITALANAFSTGTASLTSNGMSAFYPIFVDNPVNVNTCSLIKNSAF